MVPHHFSRSGTSLPLDGEEATFIACTFWLVDALGGIGRADEARELFDRLLDLRNDVGLLSEEYDVSGHRLANALHFIDDQTAALRRIRGYLKPSGTLLIVEYDITRRSRWVPYPISLDRLRALITAAGFDPPTLLATAPSRYWSRIYSVIARASIGQGRSPGPPYENDRDAL